MSFIFSDKDAQNFPQNQTELNARLAEVAKGLPQQGRNIAPFVIPAFMLLRDCDLIKTDNTKILQQKYMNGCKMNPIGDVLKHHSLPIKNSTG